MKFLQALRNVSSKLSAEFEDSKLFEHSAEKGNFREETISQLLRPFLPNCYAMGTGQIFSCDGNTSKQIDIVIYDNVYSNVLFKNRKDNLFPCESVYGEIEIKSMLSTDELIKSLDNIASLKKLNRQDSTILDISPTYHLNIGEGLTASNDKLNPYLCMIFCFDGLLLTTLVDKLNYEMSARNSSELPDFIFCSKKKYMIIKAGSKFYPTPIGTDFDKFFGINSFDDTIPMMFFTLNTCLNQIRLKAPNYDYYWGKLFNEIKNKNIEELSNKKQT
jgi:hypothetical protein